MRQTRGWLGRRAAQVALVGSVMAGAGCTGGPAATATPAATAGLVTYHQNVQGHLATPAAGPRPGVVMIHEWWGLNDQIKAKADELAREGYVVLAVDLFKGQVATTREQAQAQTQALDAAEAEANLKAAVAYLRGRSDVRGDKIASLGWCFGGAQSLRLAQAQKDLAATVIYYGQVTTDANALKGLPPILGIFGEADQSIPMETVRAFDQALDQAGTPSEIHTYPGAPHAFANPTNTTAYRPEAAADAWAKTLAFLRARLQ